MKDFRLSLIVTIICLALAGYWGFTSGTGAIAAITLAAILGVMEVSLSFDNAVVNAGVLKDMEEKWQQIFLTIGILIAVFGMRLLFPILIVTIATGLDMAAVLTMALENPEEYARHLQDSHIGIAAFGGIFLMLVFLSFLFDEGKELHWLGTIEERLSRLGKLDSIAVMTALLILFILYYLLPLNPSDRPTMLIAGIGGVILYIAVSSIDNLFSSTTAKRSGIAGFLYLEILDASFSFDGVIGAFAITRDVVIIMLGLAIGAMFVRSLTVHLVRKGTLDEYVFLEHGAHYAIGILAAIMLTGIVYHVSEVITGLIGVICIVLSLVSSIKYRAAAVTD